MDEKANINESLEESAINLAFIYAGKLLLRSEISLSEPEFQSMLKSGNFTRMVSIKKRGTTLECQRCGNTRYFLFGQLPSTDHNHGSIYCRKCIVMGRITEHEALYYWSGMQPKWPKYENPLTWDGKLTEEQQHASFQIIKKVNTNTATELLIWAVTGSGKTEMLFPGIEQALKLGKRVCIATPRADVVRELLPRLQQAFLHVPVQALYGGSKDKDGSTQIIISTTHQLIRYQEAFDLIVIDEIDAFPYHVDDALPYAAKRSIKKNGTMVYLTATPRESQRTLVAKKSLPHVFVPIRFHRHPLPIPQFIMCFSLKRDLKSFQPPRQFITWLMKRQRKDRQLLIFVPTIQLANKLGGTLATTLIAKDLLTSRQSIRAVHSEDKERKNTIQLFRENKLSTLITTTILERGVTFPSVDVAVIHAGHHVFDEAALVQVSGRAGRSPNDPTGEVVFFHNGKTNAMVEAVRSIKKMNRRGGFR